MADIRLGLPGLEYVLPDIRYEPGSEPEIPVECQKNVQDAKMADGSSRFNILAVHPKSFRFTFDQLTAAEAEWLEDLCNLDEELSLINEYVSATAYRVVVMSYTGPDPIAHTTGRAVVRYRMSIDLRGSGVVV